MFTKKWLSHRSQLDCEGKNPEYIGIVQLTKHEAIDVNGKKKWAKLGFHHKYHQEIAMGKSSELELIAVVRVSSEISSVAARVPQPHAEAMEMEKSSGSASRSWGWGRRRAPHAWRRWRWWHPRVPQPRVAELLGVDTSDAVCSEVGVGSGVGLWTRTAGEEHTRDGGGGGRGRKKFGSPPG
jgi:hypothetical protein